MNISTKTRKNYRQYLLAFLFLLPFILFVLLCWIGPLGTTILLSFSDAKYVLSRMSYAGFSNYIKIFRFDLYVPEILKITMFYIGCVLIINALFSFLLAIMVTYYIKQEMVGAVYRLLWFLPRMLPTIIYALMWIWFIDPDIGLLNPILKLFGFAGPESWILQKPFSYILLVAVNGFIGVSWGMLIYSAAIKSIPISFFEAAMIDGATRFQIIKEIILPLLRWPMLFVTAWQTLSLMGSYGEILAIWGSHGTARAAGVDVWALYTYFKAFALGDYSYAAALSMILVIVGIILILIYFKIFGYGRLMQST